MLLTCLLKRFRLSPNFRSTKFVQPCWVRLNTSATLSKELKVVCRKLGSYLWPTSGNNYSFVLKNAGSCPSCWNTLFNFCFDFCQGICRTGKRRDRLNGTMEFWYTENGLLLQRLNGVNSQRSNGQNFKEARKGFWLHACATCSRHSKLHASNDFLMKVNRAELTGYKNAAQNCENQK